MKSETNKKIGLVAMLTTLLWFPVKSLWNSSEWFSNEDWWEIKQFSDYWIGVQGLYWVPNPDGEFNHAVINSFKIADFILVVVTFLVWIISFLKIRKIKDKDLKHKKTKMTFWIIFVLILIIVLISLYIWMVNTDMIDELF